MVLQAVREAVSIPVIANGNIRTLQDVHDCIAYTGVQGVMSAESLLEDPALFWPHRLQPGGVCAPSFTQPISPAHPPEFLSAFICVYLTVCLCVYLPACLFVVPVCVPPRPVLAVVPAIVALCLPCLKFGQQSFLGHGVVQGIMCTASVCIGRSLHSCGGRQVAEGVFGPS